MLSVSNLRTIEKKVLGAMLIHADDSMFVNVTMKTLATTMGYKTVGGAITSAIQALEMKNFITSDAREYTILL